MKNLKAIVAVSENGVIGREGSIPWHLPEDLKFFKKSTQGGILLMGRKTFESISKPLPGRETWVLTTNKDWTFPEVETIFSIEAVLEKAKGLGKTVWVCGGSAVYEKMLPYCSELYLTRVHKEVEGDTYFPSFGKLFKEEVELDSNDLFSVYLYKNF